MKNFRAILHFSTQSSARAAVWFSRRGVHPRHTYPNNSISGIILGLPVCKIHGKLEIEIQKRKTNFMKFEFRITRTESACYEWVIKLCLFSKFSKFSLHYGMFFVIFQSHETGAHGVFEAHTSTETCWFTYFVSKFRIGERKNGDSWRFNKYYQ